MITGYGCRNFRAFEEANLEVRPITILLGANGVGKTSLLQIPLLLQQTAQASTRDYRSPLKIHGHSVSFGDALNILFNHRESEICYGREAMQSRLGGKNIADWVKILAANYAHNIEKVRVDDETVKEGPVLFIHVAGSIAENPTLVAWSGNDYQFVRNNMPRVRILDRDQAMEALAEKAFDLSTPLIGAATMVTINAGDTFHGISDSTIIRS